MDVCILTMGASIFMFSSGTLCVRFQVPTSGKPREIPLSLVSSKSIFADFLFVGWEWNGCC